MASTSFLPLVEKTGAAEGVPYLRYAEYSGTISLNTVDTMRKKLEENTVNSIIEALTKD